MSGTYTEDDHLKLLGIAFQEPGLVEQYYHSLKGVIVASIGSTPIKGVVLDLDSLPNDPFPFKTIFIKWLISVNLSRLKRGEEPVTDISVILKCPIWKVIKPPLKTLTLTKEKVFNRPSVQTVGKTSKPGSINKKK